MNEKKELKGLGGWLILVAIGLVFSTVLLPVSFFPLIDILDAENWQSLSEFMPETFNSATRLLIFAEIAVNALLFFACLYLLYLFFKKHYLFPRYYIVIQVAALISILIDSCVLYLINPNEPVFDSDTVKSLMRGLFSAAIWIPYMLKSERVKNTFIEHRPFNKT